MFRFSAIPALSCSEKLATVFLGLAINDSGSRQVSSPFTFTGKLRDVFVCLPACVVHVVIVNY